jgi:hypothetical protein
MPAQTISTTNQTTYDDLGSLKLTIYHFDSVADGDTFTQKIGSIMGYWCNSAGPGSDVDYVAATGVFTFHMGGTAACQLFVITEN